MSAEHQVPSPHNSEDERQAEVRVTTDQLETSYPLIEISEHDLQKVNLDEDEIAQLTPEHRHTIAHMMRNHFINDYFWSELRHMAGIFLEDLANYEPDA